MVLKAVGRMAVPCLLLLRSFAAFVLSSGSSKAEWQSLVYASAKLRNNRDVVLEAVSRMAKPRSMLRQSLAATVMWNWKQ